MTAEYTRFVENTAALIAQAELSEYREFLSKLAHGLIENGAAKYGKTVGEVAADVAVAMI